MSDPKTTLLVLGAGCAAMIGVAAAVVSAGSFFSDLPTTSAQASVYQLPPRKVKTVAIVDKPAEKGPAVTPNADRSSTASVVPVREKSALHGASPRWARVGSSNSPSLSDRQALLAAYADDQADTIDVSTGTTVLPETVTPDDPFAMIVTPDENSEPSVELAGTVLRVPAPAPRQSAAKEPDDDNDAPAPKVATTGRALSDSSTLNEAANMRAAPRSGSRVLMVVPDGARISIAPGCEQWCEISYNGRRGFVYKDFIGGGRAASRPRAKTETVSADPLDKTIYGDSNFISSGKPGAKASQSDDGEQSTADAAAAPAKKIIFEPPNR
ncbi:MAG: SH3 domain-containing protein [Rhizobiaceae bacterium]|nr:SH3 domain-containing protein [Rhizobiaceae bacterium]